MSTAAQTYSARRTNFQLISRAWPGGRPSSPPPPPGGLPPFGGRGGGGLGGWFLGGGGVPSSARLTTSIGSRNCGSMSSRTGGMIAVGRTSCAGTPAAECRAALPASAAVGTEGMAPVSAAWRPDAPSATDPCGLSEADRSWRSSLFTGRARAVARRSCAARPPRRAGGARGAEHVRLHQVIPTAGPAYLHHMYCELVVTGRQQHEFLGGTR